MNEGKTLTKDLGFGRTLAYQMLASEAVFQLSERYPVAYSVLVLLAENDTVLQSETLYDVSRLSERCLGIMNELFEHSVLPSDAKRTLEAYA